MYMDIWGTHICWTSLGKVLQKMRLKNLQKIFISERDNFCWNFSVYLPNGHAIIELPKRQISHVELLVSEEGWDWYDANGIEKGLWRNLSKWTDPPNYGYYLPWLKFDLYLYF